MENLSLFSEIQPDKPKPVPGEARSILTRTTGYLKSVTSHSLQPYRGCTFGRSLCGVACYVQHNRWVTQGREWGSFLEPKHNAAALYQAEHGTESRWARCRRGRFSIFLSSSTDPYVPQEKSLRLTRGVLEAMLELPPDELVLQTHADGVLRDLDLLIDLRTRCDLRVHISVESDLERLPGLPAPACSVERRLEAAAKLKKAGLRVVITVSPLLPIQHPEAFFGRIARVADGVVLDHFMGGDGSADGRRTLRTELPKAMASVLPESVGLEYRDRMVRVAQRILPGQVGVGIDGFAGRWLP